MTNKELCMALMKAESEKEVIDLLESKGYWSNKDFWRFYGDKENNYSAAGNQANEAESALVEKITNSRDAILMNACLEADIDPKSDKAPNSVKNAVSMFFDDQSQSELSGQIKEWSDKKRRTIAKNISVYITGNKPTEGYPCISIADRGEGQTPLNIPKTILSLGESIKRKIGFVHGKWNMGGTAALVYCGKTNLQFILSRRNPKLIDSREFPSDDDWGFTIVRRENPSGNETSSTYKYLAPVNAHQNPGKGEILHFQSDTMPIFAEYNSPYSVESIWGTMVKLYEYETKFKQNVQGSGGLLRPLDLLAPDLGLPFRLHECRYEGTPGSFEHQVNGLIVRLFDDRGNALEKGFPTTHELNIEGEKISISVYAFKDNKAKTYRENDKGVIFVLNGQAQGWLHDRIFNRKKVNLGYLKNSLIVMVECSKLSYRAQEKLFVNDRVHLRKGPFQDKIIDEMVDYLAHHTLLSQLQEERRRKKKSERLDDSKPIEAVLSNLFKHSSALSRIFLQGQRLSNPFKTKRVDAEKKEYQGQQYPNYFRFKKLDYGEILNKNTYFNEKSRITFETDANNDYFGRKTNPGTYQLYEIIDEEKVPFTESTFSLNLLNGIATLNLEINDYFKVGSSVTLELEVTDPMRIIDPPFCNRFVMIVHPERESTGGKTRTPRILPPSGKEGDGRESMAGIDIPEPTPVYKEDWEEYEFDKYSALKVIVAKSSEGKPVYDFYINMDNIYLEYEIKDDVKNADNLKSQYLYGMVLLGLGVIYDYQQNSKNDDQEGPTLEDQVATFSRSMSMMIIPMIQEFSDIEKAELESLLED
ncbi:hypothetical protein [Robiginitalea sp. IMCC43444]|uniref:hypothetical protein n=1 Tax=Robiginitalea sp. IMCC43444 TaxID=3459121 RepID=UPI004042DD2A